MAALEAILKNRKDNTYSATYVMLDNSAAVQALQSSRTKSSAWRVEKFCKMAQNTAAPARAVWVPSHESIPENEVAGHLARAPLVNFSGNVNDPKVLTLSIIDWNAHAIAM